MGNNDTYFTIEAASEGIFKDKGSKFIAFAFPVTCDDDIKNQIQHLKKEHHTARHHCYAYRLGAKGENYRANDDGEPTGTAGRPILGQLYSHMLTNTLIVVVRYFGGTLLGVSGLINAYKKAAADAINNAIIKEKIIENHYLAEFEYPLQNAVMKIIKDFNLEITKSTFEMNCKIEIAIRLSNEGSSLRAFEKIEGLKISKKQ